MEASSFVATYRMEPFQHLINKQVFKHNFNLKEELVNIKNFVDTEGFINTLVKR